MRKPWTRRKASADIEAALRAHRPEPRPEIVKAITDRVIATHRQSGRTTRLAFAGAFVAVVAFATVGGIGFAGSGGELTSEPAGGEVTGEPTPKATGVTTDGTGRHGVTSEAEPTQPAAHPPTAECGNAVKSPRREKQDRRMRRIEELRTEIAACQPRQSSPEGE